MKTRIAVLMSLLIFTACHGANPPATTLVINQRIIDGQLLCVNGIHYVAVSDLAKSLNGMLRREGDRLAISIDADVFLPAVKGASNPTAIIVDGSRPSLQAVNAGDQQILMAGMGTVKGTVVYYFNRNYGSKPDVGSEVWLVGPNVEIPEDRMFIGTTKEIIVVNPKNESQKTTIPVIRHTMVDGNGNLELTGVPAGWYTIVMESKHTDGPKSEGLRITQRDVLHRIEYRAVEVKPNQISDVSIDFGMSQF